MNYVLLFFFVLFLLLGIYGCRNLYVPSYKGPKSDHFDGKKFHNLGGNKMGSFRKLMQYQLKNKKEKWPTIESTVSQTIKARVTEGINYKLINHATVLIQHQSLNILTDPVYSKRASPLSWMGPKRHRPPSIAFDSLPHIDIIVISHDHYDHLDTKTLKKLSDKFQPKILVGLGLKRFLEKFGIENVFEMDWGESTKIKDMEIHFHSAKHWSNRFANPYKTLWGSWSFHTDKKTIYFAGDTGFSSHFENIKTELGTIDLALIPIGAYVPRFFMQHVHMPPEDAVKAHEVLQPKESLAIHWGTFQLTQEGMYSPINELESITTDKSITNFYADKDHNRYYFQE